jgi:60 kDa SS-A/Ro ribonucleoprotein
VYSFSDRVVEVPARRGLALRDAIHASQPHNGTLLGNAVEWLNTSERYDRLIVITDEQAADTVPAPKGKGYVINVASYKNGVGYGKWTHIDGWSESVIEYIRTLESPANGWVN